MLINIHFSGVLLQLSIESMKEAVKKKLKLYWKILEIGGLKS